MATAWLGTGGKAVWERLHDRCSRGWSRKGTPGAQGQLLFGYPQPFKPRFSHTCNRTLAFSHFLNSATHTGAASGRDPTPKGGVPPPPLQPPKLSNTPRGHTSAGGGPRGHTLLNT